MLFNRKLPNMNFKFYSDDDGPQMIVMNGDRPFDLLPVRGTGQTIFKLCPALIGVIRCVRHGSAVPLIEIPFPLRFPRTAYLQIEMPVGSKANVCIGYGYPTGLGARDPQVEFKVILETTMTPQELVDLLRNTLVTLAKQYMDHMLEKDPPSLKAVGEALAIFEHEGHGLSWDMQKSHFATATT
jgi:hypothetical protein